MNCRDCFHWEACKSVLENATGFKLPEGYEGSAERCNTYVPTADVVEVRHGEWHYNPNGMDWGLGAWECSLCRCTNNNLPMDEKINPRVWAGAKYCPNCGARMDGERKEQE